MTGSADGRPPEGWVWVMYFDAGPRPRLLAAQWCPALPAAADVVSVRGLPPARVAAVEYDPADDPTHAAAYLTNPDGDPLQYHRR